MAAVSTKRTPIARPPRSRITDEVIDLFLRHGSVWPTYLACLRGRCSAKRGKNGQRCPDCRECIDLSAEIGRLLGVTPWQTSPLEAFSDQPPDYYRVDQHADWQRARATRLALIAAARNLTSTLG